MCKVFWVILLNLTSLTQAFAGYPLLGRTDDESLTIAVQIIEGYLGKESPALVKRLPSPHPQSRFTKRCGLQTDQSRETIERLLKSEKLTLEKNTSSTSNSYILGIQGRPDVSDLISVDFPGDERLNILNNILPLEGTYTKRGIQLTQKEIVAAFDALFFISSTPNPKRKFGIHKPYKYIGEDEWTKRIHISCAELGWSCYDFAFVPVSEVNEKLQKKLFHLATACFKPDYAISIHFKHPLRGSPGIELSYLTETFNHIMRADGSPTNLGNELLKFDGIIDCNPSQDWLETFKTKNNKPQMYILHGYPTSQTTSYKALTFNGIFYCGNNWDAGRSSSDSKELFKSLEKLGLMYVYGPTQAWPHLGASYKGPVPVDGTSLLERISECGVGLCIHSNEHMSANIPMSRFFEICAASGLAICDNHPWIREHFGDAALFFDHTKPWEDRVTEIKAHWDWIQAHPDEAKAIAKRAHTKFREAFTMPHTLRQIEAICVR